MRFWVGVSAAFGAGSIIGVVAGRVIVEKKLEEKYRQATAAHWRVVQAVKIDIETPSLTEEDLIHIKPKDPDMVELRQDGSDEPYAKVRVPEETVVDNISSLPQTTNPYHTAVQQTSNPGVYASYAELSEEDYQEDDGRVKEQLTMVFSDNEPIFFQNGMEIDTSEAMDMVGSTIVDDMRKAVGDGNPFLWVRNNQTDIDYEVVFEQP